MSNEQQLSVAQKLVSDGLLTIKETCAFLKISKSKLYELMAAGRLPYLMVDGARRIPLKAVQDFAAGLLVMGTVAAA